MNLQQQKELQQSQSTTTLTLWEIWAFWPYLLSLFWHQFQGSHALTDANNTTSTNNTNINLFKLTPTQPSSLPIKMSLLLGTLIMCLIFSIYTLVTLLLIVWSRSFNLVITLAIVIKIHLLSLSMCKKPLITCSFIWI